MTGAPIDGLKTAAARVCDGLRQLLDDHRVRLPFDRREDLEACYAALTAALKTLLEI